jgi:hypothetical protein
VSASACETAARRRRVGSRRTHARTAQARPDHLSRTCISSILIISSAWWAAGTPSAGFMAGERV